MSGKEGGLVGIQTAKLAVLDDKGFVKPDWLDVKGFGINPKNYDNGIYTISTDSDGGVTKANISGLAPAIKEIYGNNTQVDVSVGSIKPSIDFETNFLDHNVLNSLLGRHLNDNGSWTGETDSNQMVALDIVSNDVAGNTVHIGFYQGRLLPGNMALATNNDNETRINDVMSYKPMAKTLPSGRTAIFDVGFSSDTKFVEDDFLKSIFPTSGTTPASSVTISVHYQDDDGHAISGLSDTSVTGKAGDSYTIPTPTVTGYTYEKATAALTGTFTTSQNVVVTYKKNA